MGMMRLETLIDKGNQLFTDSWFGDASYAGPRCCFCACRYLLGFGRGDDTVGNPHRAQISQFELVELILLLKLDKQLPVEQFEATVIISVNSTLPPSWFGRSERLVFATEFLRVSEC